MTMLPPTIAEQIAEAARDSQEKRTGHRPKAITVIFSGNTLVITLNDALSPAEKEMAKSPAGIAKVQEFHRQLFANSSEELRETIKQITGVMVREAAAEVEAVTGTLVHAFTSGTMVQVFQLAEDAPPLLLNVGDGQQT